MKRVRRNQSQIFLVYYPFKRLVQGHILAILLTRNKQVHLSPPGDDRAAVRAGRYAFARWELRFYFHYLHFRAFFFLSAMSNVQALLPTVTFCTQSRFLTQFVTTFSGFVLHVVYCAFLFFYPLSTSLFQCYYKYCIVRLSVLSAQGHADNTFWALQKVLEPLHFFHYKNTVLFP